jgi:hypothetical protein
MSHKDYDRKGSVKKILVVSLKGLGAKTKCLALNRLSQSNFNFDFDFGSGLFGLLLIYLD